MKGGVALKQTMDVPTLVRKINELCEEVDYFDLERVWHSTNDIIEKPLLYALLNYKLQVKQREVIEEESF